MKYYKWKRRYFKLDRVKQVLVHLRDKEIDVPAPNLDASTGLLIKSINEKEGTHGVIPEGGTPYYEPYVGFYLDAEKQYENFSSLDRLHFDGEIFDYIFYTEEGKYNGENDRYLSFDGILFRVP